MTPIKIDAELMRQFDHIHDMFLYQMDIVTTQREVLTDALTIYETVLANRLASISNRINTSIKRLTFIMFFWTAMAVILSIPNTIATVLGIPEWPLTVDAWGIIATVLVLSMIIPSIWFYVYWKRLKSETRESL
jgi:Mg2+ and Co2+ transporter CorA